MRLFRQLSIQWKITILSFGIVAFALMMVSISLLGYVTSIKEDELSNRTMITAQLVAQNHTVQQWVDAKPEEASRTLQPIVERIRVINDHDYIVLLNMDRIRITHPIPERLQTPFVGGDEDPAFAEHIYLSKAKTEGVVTVRAFMPILNQQREQVGVAVVGSVLPSYADMIQEFWQPALLIGLITALFGFWGSWLLASHIKRQTFNMEPDELAHLLVERDASFNAIHEGVVAINKHEKITIMNEAARRMLGVKEKAIGRNIHEVIPDTKLPEILSIGKPLYQREFYIQGRLVFSNRIPIQIDGETVGAIAIFQDKSDVDRLAEELTGVQAFVDALRVQNHEYSNKLHTIAGLIQLDEGKKALQYIFDLEEEQEEFSGVVMQKIHNDSLAGLLLGKVSRGKELGVQVIIEKDSEFIDHPEGVTTHDLVVIVGNLIDNSLDAFSSTQDQNKTVHVFIGEENDFLKIRVRDNGEGIREEVREKMFVRGFSTKSTSGRGIGLFLIQAIVERVEGKIEVESELNIGTTFSIYLPKKRG
ncbi:sensor histidine kinase [Halalkalibacterium halodurans]|uniref:Probable C4-dicarboxylate sensor kinase n=2 Tax=Halalkalibacterium halodurans TaxID=86665 RepID=DCTS_HALH5|nr:sensor histidine kinase [Halalkalibacterium halodurans]Q9K997.1 RecName: Full=Probable C4-dicarboxylate sensor kinase [Halalkalibacterium halodurans C-125]MDY7223303.1 sensor histidine kinase [Halalkalibacterium halodurans]MDY7242524.1 sensor histidine kinase [Halalkalibacterium halodurans]MED4080261.1 sensor histidine kinase [Halalkalibacterium halodurans]MED4084671.1 sensor histidine kinase [Halalkalibacterium halodurans]MED4103949.1 sensor histidine kinase [Halalkalibacterium halodurans